MCDLDHDYYSGGFCSTTDITKARAVHKCSECSRVVRVGQPYRKIAGTWDGYFFHMKICSRCSKLIDWLGARGHGWIGDQLADDVRECALWEVAQRKKATECTGP